ncbi:hypothetical protein DOTSEDRAFT_69142 [Dothistroma septosporum NZE10]|uniref:Uncharacterized protein n=1 Tax=Dothistroma septosporum (strain NZE10 / CBS 128990) TaxID=675120 RepID=N1PUC9_DOTSN|nr:hypothetical protein DOTSEDRAFT_69142 [Dothistroma septosporum NZE10]
MTICTLCNCMHVCPNDRLFERVRIIYRRWLATGSECCSIEMPEPRNICCSTPLHSDLHTRDTAHLVRSSRTFIRIDS